jgi:hypothetical protein
MSFVDAHDFSVDLVLQVLGIPASTYYDWRARRTAPSLRQREDEELLRLIDAIRGEHEFAATYGSPRVWLELRRRGVRVGRKRVERIMRVHGRQGAYLRRGWKHGSTRQNPRHTAPPDLLGRDFTATAPNTKWVADLTRILTVEGVLWPACEMRSPTRWSVGTAAHERPPSWSSRRSTTRSDRGMCATGSWSTTAIMPRLAAVGWVFGREVHRKAAEDYRKDARNGLHLARAIKGLRQDFPKRGDGADSPVINLPDAERRLRRLIYQAEQLFPPENSRGYSEPHNPSTS